MPETSKAHPSDARDEDWWFTAPYLVLIRNMDAGQREHNPGEVFHALDWIMRAEAPWRMRSNAFPLGRRSISSRNSGGAQASVAACEPSCTLPLAGEPGCKPLLHSPSPACVSLPAPASGLAVRSPPPNPYPLTRFFLLVRPIDMQLRLRFGRLHA